MSWLVWVLALIGAISIAGVVARWLTRAHAISTIERKFRDWDREYRKLMLKDEKSWEDVDHQISLMEKTSAAHRVLNRLRGY
jgi:hypothetical protein